MLSNNAGLLELENRPVHLRMKEDENKLSFQRGGGISKQNAAYQSMNDYDERHSIPTRGTGAGIASTMHEGYEQYSNIRSSQKSGAFASGMH